MQIPASQALWFLVLVAPIVLFTFYVDMKYKKITNVTVWALFGVFVVVGLATMAWPEFLWRFAHYAVVFAYGLALWFMRQIGAGDVKFASVAALYLHVGDLRLVLVLAGAAILAAAVTVYLVRISPLQTLAPDWASWSRGDGSDPATVGGGRQFTIPMGTGLGMMLVAYLALGALFGA